jgi:hypothetical protein
VSHPIIILSSSNNSSSFSNDIEIFWFLTIVLFIERHSTATHSSIFVCFCEDFILRFYCPFCELDFGGVVDDDVDEYDDQVLVDLVVLAAAAAAAASEVAVLLLLVVVVDDDAFAS